MRSAHGGGHCQRREHRGRHRCVGAGGIASRPRDGRRDLAGAAGAHRRRIARVCRDPPGLAAPSRVCCALGIHRRGPGFRRRHRLVQHGAAAGQNALEPRQDSAGGLNLDVAGDLRHHGPMALAILVTLEKEVLDASVTYAKSGTGKALARESDKLDGVARSKRVSPITSLLSESQANLIEQLKADGFDPSKMRLPPEQWYAASEGLKT